MMQIVANPTPVVTRLSIVSGFDHNKRDDGWTLLEDTSELADFEVGELELVTLVESSESSIAGKTVLKRARGEMSVNGQKLVGCNYGQRHGEALVRNQHLIPVEMRGKVIVLPGTVWLSNTRNLRASYLVFDEGRWVMRFTWLNSEFSSLYHLLRRRNLSSAA
jgi:hypothetical protein